MKLFVTVLLLFVAWGAAGQKVVSGRTVDTEGAAVGSVNIMIRDTRIGTASDNSGRFTLSIPARLMRDTLIITHVAYEELKVPVAGLGGNETFTLIPASYTADDAVVEARRLRRKTLDERGEKAGLWAWTFSRELAEFGSFFEVEDQFLVDNFRFRVLRNSRVPLRAEVVVYHNDDDAWQGWQNILQEPIYVDFRPDDPMDNYMDSLDTRPYERLERVEDGFIEMENPDTDYIRTVKPAQRLLLEKGRYMVTLRYVVSGRTMVLADRYPWVLPRFAVYNEPGMRRGGRMNGNEPSPFMPCDRNAGIIVRGYGK